MSPFTFPDASARYSRSLNNISDPWHAPRGLKAIMFFDIAFFVMQLPLLCVTILYLNRILPWSACGPYLLHILVIFLLAVAYIVVAVYLRLTTDLSHRMADALWIFSAFLFEIEIAFRPALVLYLLHVRGSILRETYQAKGFRPLMSKLWKRIFDWAFILINCIAGIMLIAYTHYTFTHPPASELRTLDYKNTRLDLSRMCVGFRIFSYLLVIFSCTVMSAQLESRKLVDRVVKRLVATIPFFILLAVDRLIVLVLLSDQDDDYSINFELARVIMQGTSRVGISGLLVWTMVIPGVQWIAPPVNQTQSLPTNFEIVSPIPQMQPPTAK